jgi:hypothetical protein
MNIKIKKFYYIALILAVLVVTALVVNRIFIKHDYLISYEIPCDPETEDCFVYTCDPEVDTECDPTEGDSYYKIVEKKAYNAIMCSEEDYECLSCAESEENCTVTFCDASDENNTCSEKILEDENFLEESNLLNINE